MVGKLVDGDKLNSLAQGLDKRSKERDNILQQDVNTRLTKPLENGEWGQILSLDADGNTEWIDNAELISTGEIDGLVDEIFKDEIDVEGEMIEVNKIKMITTGQIDDIMNSVF